MIKYLIMDVDGTLTDGKIYMGPDGEAMKAFSVKDGMVINYILKPAGIVPVIITARNNSIVQHRCDELGITEVYQGKIDKLTMLEEIVGNDGLGNCAYFGDDILDLKCMSTIKEAGGIAACPVDAVREVKAVADYVCISKAGEGALREFAEWLVKPKIDDKAIEKKVAKAVDFLLSIDVNNAKIGKMHIVDDDFYYSIQTYVTKPAEQCKLESHRKYIDIQIMVEGQEVMDIIDVSRLELRENYNSDKDVMFWNIPNHMVRITLKPGDYIVLYPENAHRGAVIDKQVSCVKKIVGKLRVL